MQAKRGFTLVEILIVVVILGILAAIVIPQFTQASTEAKTNSLASDLQSLRSQIQLYKVQHNDNPPALGTFADQMIYCTDVLHNVKPGANSAAKVRDATFCFGPYLERVPANPFTNSTLIADWASSAVTDGWEYNAATGEIRAAIDTIDPNAHQSL
jgi:general secretion pathway protein G